MMEEVQKEVEFLLRKVSRRIRLNKAFSSLVNTLIVVWGGSFFVLFGFKLFASTYQFPFICLLCLSATPLGLLIPIISYLIRIDPFKVAIAIDDKLNLPDIVTNCYLFLRGDEYKRSPFVKLYLEKSRESIEKIVPSKIEPIKLPKRLPLLLPLIVINFIPFIIKPLKTREIMRNEVKESKKIDYVEISDELLLDFYKYSIKLKQEEVKEDEETKQLKEQFNQLISKLAIGKISYKEAMNEIDRIIRKFPEIKGYEKRIENYFENLGKKFLEYNLTKGLGKSLYYKDTKATTKEINKLKEALKKGDPELKKKLEELRKAFNEASKIQPPPTLKERLEELRNQYKSLLEKDKREELTPKTEKNLLKKNEDRELKRLEREIKKNEELERRLQRLQRLLQDLKSLFNPEDLPNLQNQLENFAEEFNKFEELLMEEKKLKELSEKLLELKELLKQLKQGGEKLKLRLLKFEKLAGGGTKKINKNELKKALLLGCSDQNEKGLIFTSKMEPKDSGIKGDKKEGKGIGVGRDDSMLEQPTKGKGKRVDIEAQLQDYEDGEVKIEPMMITQAGEKGFVTKNYRRIYKIYREFGESVIEREKIPEGYRHLLRKYFELIRPRE